jgi:hypothetical protein
MKKFLFAAIVVLGIALAALMGCAGNVEPVADRTLNLPPHIERMMKKSDTLPNDTITLRDYRDDGSTLWMWIDKGSVPGTCDYVVIFGILDKDKDRYKVLGIISPKNSTNPCSTAYREYEAYSKAKATLKKTQPKDGI